MNIITSIHIDNSDAELLAKLEKLKNDFESEEYDNDQGYGRCYNAGRRYRRLLNKLSGSKNATTHMITSGGYSSSGAATLLIGN